MAIILIAMSGCTSNKKIASAKNNEEIFVYKNGKNFFRITPSPKEKEVVVLSPKNEKRVQYENTAYILDKDGKIISIKKKGGMFLVYYTRNDDVIHIIDSQNVGSIINIKIHDIYNFFSQEELGIKKLEEILNQRKITLVKRKRSSSLSSLQ